MLPVGDEIGDGKDNCRGKVERMGGGERVART
jgi:hypothetical protein